MKALHKIIYILLHRITSVGLYQTLRYYLAIKLLRRKKRGRIQTIIERKYWKHGWLRNLELLMRA